METIELFKGDDWEIPFQYTLDGDPYDITGSTELLACFKGDAATVSVSLTGGEISIVNALAGKILVTVPKAKTELVKKGENDVMVIKTDVSGKEKSNLLVDLVNVKERTC